MKTTSLAGHYPALTAWERLPLIRAATARGDNVERQRLLRSAPLHRFSMTDHQFLEFGLLDLAKFYVMEQLELAGVFWPVLGLLQPDEPLLPPEQGDRLVRMVRLVAHRCVVRADAWKQVCAELAGRGPGDWPRQLPGYEWMCETEAQARAIAFTDDEAARAWQALAAERPGEKVAERPGRVVTLAEEAGSMRQFLEDPLDQLQGTAA